MGLLKNILFVPIVMACATIGTIGMVMGIRKFFYEKSDSKSST